MLCRLRVVNRFRKRSLNDHFLFRFSIVFKNDGFVFGKNDRYFETTHSFWIFRKRKTIVWENDRFLKTICVSFLYDCFWKKLHWMSFYMKLTSCGGAKTSWYFLKNYSIINTDDLQVVFLTSLTIVNEGSSLTMVKIRQFLYQRSFKIDNF